jgi:SAM-dependent methyltransferase
MSQIVAFNWPKLAGAVLAVAAALVVTGLARGMVAAVGGVVAGGLSWFLGASLAVSWWVYDRSDLQDWRWLRPMLAGAGSWASVHAGFDDAGPALPAALGAPAAVVDMSPMLGRVSPSLRRARRLHPAAGAGRLAVDGLPLGTSSMDAVVLVFSAHEVRERRRREALFSELRRVVRPGGRVVLVEHLRDAVNVAAFGLGAWHFRTRASWVAVGRRCGLRLEDEAAMTAFVRALVLCPC